MKKGLQLSEYANDIHLFKDCNISVVSNKSKEQLVDELLLGLDKTTDLNKSYADKRRLLHAKQNMLEPFSLNPAGINLLNDLLQIELHEKEITTTEQLVLKSGSDFKRAKVAVWQGDITTLKIDAIVNAANNQLLGCRQPLHACIDNAIHTAAGMQLRDDCDAIMQKQAYAEPTGTAKITRAYNLPSKFVLHTVGPIVRGNVSEQNKAELAGSYTNCLEIGKEVKGIRSIAFCCISTGVFAYPAEQAAKVAFETVKNWLIENPDCLDLVVFNVFSDKDKKIYEGLENMSMQRKNKN